MSDFWNQRFAEPGYKYGTQANAFLQAQAHAWPSGRVLVPGDGEGRNGVWLAAQGHHVLAVDSSDVGLAKAQQLAAQVGAEVASRYATEVADLAHWQPEAGAWDAVVLVYTHLPSALRQGVHRRLAQSLRPGGWLLLEGFHPSQLGRRSGGPKDADMLMTLADLRQDFTGGLTETLGWEGEVILDEGPGHQGAAQVTRWIGQRR